MSEPNTESEWEKYLKYAISAFVSITHIIAFFQIVICSRHMAVAFNIPAKNIGIYFAKLYSLRSLLMSMGCAVEYTIYRIIQTFCSNIAINIRRYLSMGWFVLLTVCEVSFLIVLYSSKNVAYHNYVVLNLEGLIFGFFQMSILSLIPEFASYYMLSLYVSGTCIFIIQTIIDRCTKNSMLSVKIQSWICVLCSLICVGIWPVRLFVLEQVEHTLACNAQTQGSTAAATTSTSSSSSGAESSAPGGAAVGGGGSNGGSPGVGAAGPTGPQGPPGPPGKIQYVMSLTSISILKIITTKLDEICSHLGSQDILNVQILVRRLEQIRTARDITYEVLVAIDLVILNLKRCSCPRGELILLAELSLFLRIKVLVKTEQSEVVKVSHPYPGIYGHGGLPVDTLLYEYPVYGYPYDIVSGESIRAKRSLSPPKPKGRRRREAPKSEGCQNGTGDQTCATSIFYSISPLIMFPVGSLVKDFLFPGVIPYGLLERDKCHLINLIVIIFLSIGPVTIFIMNISITCFKSDDTYYHWFWSCMIPKILILIISLCAIHTKQGSTHKIRSSQPIVLLMTVVLLTCYGFLETMSFVGVAYYAKIICKSHPISTDLQAIHNVSGKFFRYLVYKLSVGYNKTRIGAGFVLPNFKPPEPIPNTFCYWFTGAFSNGWKDIKGDFKMGIQQYLEVSQTVSKKSPIDTLRFCDVLM